MATRLTLLILLVCLLSTNVSGTLMQPDISVVQSEKMITLPPKLPSHHLLENSSGYSSDNEASETGLYETLIEDAAQNKSFYRHEREDPVIHGSWGNSTSNIDPTSPSLTWNLTLEKLYALYPVDQWKAFGLFDESYLTKINPHWLKFEPASTSSHFILAFLYSVMMTVGCFGNLLVVFMFFRCRSLRTPANYLIANLAVSDFGMLIKTPVFIINSLFEGPVLGFIGCQIYGFVGGLTGTTSIMTLATIAVDRYCVIVHPLNPYKRTTHTKAVLMIVGVWMYSGFFSSIPLTVLNGYVSEGYLTSCSFDYLLNDTKSQVFIFIFFLAAWFFPLFCIVYSYVAIYRIVAQAEKMEIFTGGNTRESFKNRQTQDQMRKDVKIALVTTVIVLIWILAWTPYAIVALLGIFRQKHLITPFVSTLPALFCKVSSCLNPFIYAISHPKFQKELKIKCDSISCCKKLNLLRTCSPHSISFIQSISDNNSLCIGAKFKDPLQEDLSIDVAVQLETKNASSVSKSSGKNTGSDQLDTKTGRKANGNVCQNVKYGSIDSCLTRRTYSEPDVSCARPRVSFSLCRNDFKKLQCKHASLVFLQDAKLSSLCESKG